MAEFNILDLVASIRVETNQLSQARTAITGLGKDFQFTTAQTVKFLTKADLKEVKRGVIELQKARRELDKLRQKLGITTKAEIDFARSQNTVNRAVKAGVITNRQASRVLGVARTRFTTTGNAASRFTFRMQELTKSVQVALGPLSGIAARITAFTGLLNLASAKLALFAGGIIALSFGTFKAVKSAANFETALTGVSKTSNLTAVELEDLGTVIKTMGQRLAIAPVQLLNIAEAAGQMGIQGSRNILAFTETVGKLTLTTNLTADAAASALARILNVTQESQANVAKLGSAIVFLGNNFAASEKEIVLFTNEIARGTGQFGVSAVNAAALGTVLRSLGARAESSGSAISRSFALISGALARGGKDLKVLELIIGQTGDQIRKTFKEDANKVFNDFIAGLSRINLNIQGGALLALEAFGIKGVRATSVLIPLITNIKSWQRAQEGVNKETNEAIAINEEAAKRLKDLNTKAKQFGISLSNIASTIGKDFLPGFKNILGVLNPLISQTNTIRLAIEALGAAFIALLAAAVLPAMFRGIGIALRFLTRSAVGATIAIRGVRFALGPFIVIATLAAEAMLFFASSTDDAEEAQKKLKRTLDDIKNLDIANPSLTSDQKAVNKEELTGIISGSELIILQLQEQRQELRSLISKEAAVFGTAISASIKETRAKVFAEIDQFILENRVKIAGAQQSLGLFASGDTGTRSVTPTDPEVFDILTRKEAAALKARLLEDKQLIKTQAKNAKIISGLEFELAAFKKTDKQIEIDTALRRLNSTATATQIVKTRELAAEIFDTNAAKKSSVALDKETAKVIAEIQTPQEIFIDRQFELNRLHGLGKLSVEQYNRALKLARVELNKSALTTAALEDAVRDASAAFSSFFEDIIFNSKNASDALLGLLDSLTKLLFKAAVSKPLEGFITTLLGGFLTGSTVSSTASAVGAGFGTASLGEFGGTGFAHGGSFRIGGTGGRDSQSVRFKGTPGEEVIINPPGKSNSGGKINITIINNTKAEVDVQENKDAAGNREILLVIEEALASRIRKPNTPINRSISDTFGASNVVARR